MKDTKAEISLLSAMTDWMIVVIYYPGLLNHKEEIENNRKPSRQNLRNIFLFSLACLLDLFVEKSPAQLLRLKKNSNEAGEKMKDLDIE